MTLYKIRNKDTGLYSTGGTSPRWSKHSGKVWTNLGNLRRHLALFYGRIRYPYDNAEVVEIIVNKDNTNIKEIVDII